MVLESGVVSAFLGLGRLLYKGSTAFVAGFARPMGGN